jgi:hypothetical protein
LPAKDAAADAFVVDYAPVCARPADAYFMMWPCTIDKHGLAYASPPLAQDAHIAGHPIADVWISSSTPDADLFVYLEDIAPNGAASIVSHGRLRASHRDEQRAPYRDFMGLPYHSGERAAARPLSPGEPARMRLDLLPTSTIVKAGHRLQLRIAGADPRQRSRNVQFDPPPTIRVLRDAAHASRLSVPMIGRLQFVSNSDARRKTRAAQGAE